jgi:ribosome maturation factor RimP
VTRKHTDIRSQLIELVEPVCADSGFELVDLLYQREQGGWIVRIFIDRDGDAISFDDCEQVSRELSAMFDVEDPIPSAYSLEVSSPGVERPLRTAAHFRQFVGQIAKVALDVGVEGRRNFKGIVDGFDDENQNILMRVDGKSYALPLSDLRSAKLVVDWDAVLKAGTKAPKEQPGA